MTKRVRPDQDCMICDNPVPPKTGYGAQKQVCSDACAAERERRRHKKENDAARERKRLWYQENQERIRAAWLISQTPEKRIVATVRTKQWCKDNPEQRRKNRQAWFKANPEKRAATGQRRRARERGVPSEFVTVLELLREQDSCCHICDQFIDSSIKMPDPQSPTIDHLIPLARGGTGLRDNLKAAHMRCNSIKGAA